MSPKIHPKSLSLDISPRAPSVRNRIKESMMILVNEPLLSKWFSCDCEVETGRKGISLGVGRGGLEHTGSVWGGKWEAAPSHHLCSLCSRRSCWPCAWSSWCTVQSAPSHQRGRGKGADLAQHPTWKGHCVAQQRPGYFRRGRSEITVALSSSVVFPDKEGVAGKHLCSCMLADWGLSVHLSPRPLRLPAANESGKAGKSRPWRGQSVDYPLASF